MAYIKRWHPLHHSIDRLNAARCFSNWNRAYCNRSHAKVRSTDCEADGILLRALVPPTIAGRLEAFANASV